MTQRKRLGLSVPEHLYHRLHGKAQYEGKTMNALILQILWEWADDLLKEEEEKCRG